LLAARCPGCGAACPVSVHETETLHCDQCGHTGPHAAEVRTGLQKAAEVLGSLDVRQRQLTDGQRKRVHQARIGNIAALVILVTIFLPLIPTVLVLSVVFFFETGGLQGDAVWVPLSFSCLFLSIPLSAFVAYGWYRHRQKKLIRAWVAVPPPVQGQPARCRVCGAGLPEAQEGEVAVVRCEYCSADNLVDPATMQRLGARHARAVFFRGRRRRPGLKHGGRRFQRPLPPVALRRTPTRLSCVGPPAPWRCSALP